MGFGTDSALKTAGSPRIQADDRKTTKYQDTRGRAVVRGVSAEDVNQGEVETCWFLAPLAAVAAQWPAIIRTGVRAAGRGMYEVRLFEKRIPQSKDGKKSAPVFTPRWIPVSTDLPTKPDGSPAYAHSKHYAETQEEWGKANDNRVYIRPKKETRELWPSLYEKAMAKVMGSYDAAAWDFHKVGMEMITGVVATEIGTAGKDPQSLWDRMMKGFGAGLPMSASTYGKHKEKKYADGPLTSAHAMTIIDMKGTGPKDGTVTLRDQARPLMGGNPDHEKDHETASHFTLAFSEFQRLIEDVVIGSVSRRYGR